MIVRPCKNEDLAYVIKLWKDVGLVVDHNDPEKDISRKLLVKKPNKAGHKNASYVLGHSLGSRPCQYSIQKLTNYL